MGDGRPALSCPKAQDGLDWHRWMAGEFPASVSVLRTGARLCASALRRGLGRGLWSQAAEEDHGRDRMGIDAAGTLEQLGAAPGTPGHQTPLVTGRGSMPCLAVRNPQPAMLAGKMMVQAG